MAKRKSLLDLYKMRDEGEQITWLTAYDFPTAQFAEAAGLDMLLVGDSLGLCVYGYNNTMPVTMEQCIAHCQAVRKGAPGLFVVGDMPFTSYQTTDADAVYNAGRFLKEADVDAIKLEGGVYVAGRIKAVTDAGMVVIGHIGLTPQPGGHKDQGRTADAAKLVLEDALAVAKAGVRLLLVTEAVPSEVTAYIKEVLSIPVLSIGAGHSDGQLLTVTDLLGEFQLLIPKYGKQYANIADISIKAMTEYVKEVKDRQFPAEEHCYKMLAGEEEKFLNLMK